MKPDTIKQLKNALASAEDCLMRATATHAMMLRQHDTLLATFSVARQDQPLFARQFEDRVKDTARRLRIWAAIEKRRFN